MSERLSLLVIGGGPAGLSAARSYREAGGQGPVAIVADEHRMPYLRPPLTKDLLRGDSTEEDLPLEHESWLSEHKVTLISGRAGCRGRACRSISARPWSGSSGPLTSSR
jgi:NADPH-dependent 2,4-dienoyl-CoA reductase/sulfur reductase-like enzyme